MGGREFVFFIARTIALDPVFAKRLNPKWFEDSTRPSARFLLDRLRNRDLAGGAKVRAASCDFHQGALGVALG